MIDKALLKRTLENRFTLKYTTQAEIEKSPNQTLPYFSFG